MARHLERGTSAETLAARHLEDLGLTLVTRNFRARVGEIDLVMTDRHVLVVVEVRYRARTNVASPAETVTAVKRHRLVRATRFFLLVTHRFTDWPVRFDVVEVTGNLDAPAIHWIRNAFTLDDMAAD